MASRKMGEVPALDWSSIADANSATVLDAARIYVDLGLHPIAMHGIGPDGNCTCGKAHPAKEHPDGTLSCSAGKHPLSGRWQVGGCALEVLERQLHQAPDANVAIRMGRQPNGAFLVALDRDGPHAVIAELEAQHGRLPITLTAKTARGRHFVYCWNERYPVPKNNVSKLAAHLDVRSEGGLIVVAPSRHFSGCQYRWVKAIEPVVFP